MFEIRNTLGAESLQVLDQLRGARLVRIFGANLDTRLMSEDVTLETDRGFTTLWGEVDNLGDWEGFEGQYTVLHVDAGIPSLYTHVAGATDSAPNVESFFFHAGDLIQDVSIVRERVRMEVIGEATWEYTTDSAVVVTLSNGVLAVSETALDGEMLAVTFADSMGKLEIPAPNAFWFHWNTMGTEFVRSSQLIEVAALINGHGC